MKKERVEPEESVEERPEDEVAPESPEGADAELQELDAPEETETERLERERDEYLNHWKRAQADYQNLRRRIHTDIQASVRRNVQPLLQEILLVLDHLELALSAPSTHEETRNLAVGVQLIKDQLLGLLEKEGVSVVPEGGALDPSLHEAVGTITDSDETPGTILETVRRGYRWNDGVLRPAHVKVAAEPADDAD